MSPSLAASMRRTRRLLRPRTQTKAARNVQKALAQNMLNAAYAPLTALTSKLATQHKQRNRSVGRSLGAAITQLRAGQALMGARAPRARRGGVAPVIPEGAKYLARRYRGAAGAQHYKLYLPASQPQRPKGLVVMLHGCDQSPDDFAVGTHMNHLAEKHGLAIAYPAQSPHDNAASCWNWFRPEDQARGSGEPAVLAALTRKLMKDFGLRRDKTFVAGLSAGGAMAAILVDEYPDVFAAAGIHSGLARGAAYDVVSAMSAMRDGGTGGPDGGFDHTPIPTRRIVFHGDADGTVHPSNAVNIVTAALGRDVAPSHTVARSVRGRAYVKNTYAGMAGPNVLELWIITGAGHAWSGGRKAGTFTDTTGPDASALMVRFFLADSC